VSGIAASVRNGLRLRGRSRSRSKEKPLEYTLLLTATMCLLTFGAVMVFSASSSASLLNDGDSLFYLK
jgi:cell division protein FtsW (lipid II flippase)